MSKQLECQINDFYHIVIFLEGEFRPNQKISPLPGLLFLAQAISLPHMRKVPSNPAKLLKPALQPGMRQSTMALYVRC